MGNEAVFVGLALKLLAEIRMGDGDEGKGALGDRLSFEVDEAIFSDDVHDVGAGSGDDIAGSEVEDDAAAGLAELLVGGCHADEGFAALGSIGAAHEL